MGEVSELATKGDIAALKIELKPDMAELRSELKAHMAELRADIRGELNAQLRWIVGTTIAALAVTAAKLLP